MSKETVFNIIRIVTYLIVFYFSLLIFKNFSCPYTFDKSLIIGNLITTISILIAIIITFLFSKLFSEKTIRFERKKDIDELAKKITFLRRISFHMLGMHEFWKFRKDFNPKQIIDFKYKDLTWEQFRGLDDKNLDKRDYKKIQEEIGDVSAQAYLGMKGLQNTQNDYQMFGEFHPYNYSVEELFKFRDYTNSIWYFFESADPSIVNLNKENKYWLNFIDELYFKIFNEKINKDDYNGSMKKTFAFFESEIFDKIIYLTNLNSKQFPKTLIYSFLNMLVFLLILIASIFLLVVDLKDFLSSIIGITLISFFIANTFDLIIISFYSIKKELKLDEISKF